MLAGRGASPCVVEQLPSILRGGGAIHGGGLPRAIIHFDFNRFQWRAVVEHHTQGFEAIAFAADANEFVRAALKPGRHHPAVVEPQRVGGADGDEEVGQEGLGSRQAAHPAVGVAALEEGAGGDGPSTDES